MAYLRASQRWYNPARGVKYVLPSDKIERERLNLQNKFLTRKLCDGRLIFAPHPALRDDLQILDSATGTGIWINNAYREAPRANFIGIDIQDRLFPEVPLRNTSFSVQSVLDLPSEWSNQFDLVNQRLLMLALGKEQWKLALREVHRVLAPGGYVQFVEVHPTLDNMGPATDAHNEVRMRLHAARNLQSNIAELLPDKLRDAGFKNVWSETRSFLWVNGVEKMDLSMRILFIRGLSAFKGPMLDHGLVKDEEEYDALLEAARKEWDKVPGTGMRWTKAYACK